jgi:hypothetical protein
MEGGVLSEAQQLHGRYSQELASYKAALQDLKISFFKRQIDKGRLRPAGEQLAQLGPVADFNNPQHVEALDKLQRLVARALLDPACQDGITAADTLHKKVCQTLSLSKALCTDASWVAPISVVVIRSIAHSRLHVARTTACIKAVAREPGPCSHKMRLGQLDGLLA